MPQRVPDSEGSSAPSQPSRPVAATSRHTIRFTKLICDDTGHAHKFTQVEVRRSRNGERVIKAAQRRFARMHRSKKWDLHTDGFEVQQLEPTANASALALTKKPKGLVKTPRGAAKAYSWTV